ncbi:hypothetical protein BDF14DRAFT_1223802 [Spinellus fusiger]|nr:hypothetical protein BDF14DRAFT_1223802 [Spinellus fusiger]
MMKSVEKVVQLRQMAASYRDSMISARSFVDGVCDLCNNPEHSAAIFQSDDFIEEEEKRSEAVRVWRQLQKSTSKTSEEAVGHTTSPRVKVIKSVNTRTGGNRPTSRINVWDRVAHAAEDAESSSSLTPLVSLPNGRSKTAWSTQQQTFSTYTGTAERESTLSAPQQHFPSLPAAPPRYGAGLRQATRQSSAWTSGINDTHASEFSVPENVETPTDKKRKGKKKQVLFRVGL